MKKLLLFFCILFIGNFGFAQVSDIVQQTWHLKNILIDGTIHYVPYGEAIQLNFGGTNPNYNATTNGVENTFSANATFNNDTLTLSETQVSSTDCTAPNCDFENLYFYEFLSNQALDDKTFTYYYSVDSNGSKLFRLADSAGSRAVYTDQPLEEIDETLFRKWYLHEMGVDLGQPYFVSDYNPPIAPTLTINPDLSFTGFGSCNEFSGDFDYTYIPSSWPMLIPKNYQDTGQNCQFHNDFEDNYFSNFQFDLSLYYEVWEDPSSGDAYFSFEASPGFYFLYTNHPVLSVPDLEKKSFSVYPNPAKNRLFIKSSETNFTISITDINGRIVISNKSEVSNEIDVSALKAGMYFITVTSSEGKTSKKFIKN